MLAVQMFMNEIHLESTTHIHWVRICLPVPQIKFTKRMLDYFNMVWAGVNLEFNFEPQTHPHCAGTPSFSDTRYDNIAQTVY